MRAHVIWSLVFTLFAIGCSSETGANNGNPNNDGNATTPDVGTDAGTDDAGTTPDGGTTTPDMGPPPPTDPLGRLNVTYWAPDALYDYPELHGHAVFSPTLATAAVLDPVGWLAYQNGWDVYIPDDYWAVPDPVMSAVAAPADLGTIDDFLDAGEVVAVGEWVNANRSPEVLASDGVPIYDFVAEFAPEAAEREDLSAPLDLIIDGGDDVGPAEIADAVTMPDALRFTSHDPLQRLPVRYGVDVVIDWVPSPSEDDYIVAVISTFTEDRVWRVEDAAGTFDVTARAREAGYAIDNDTVVSFSRVLPQQVQLPDGVLHVTASQKQWFYAEVKGPWDLEPNVWPVGQTTPVTLELIDNPVPAGSLPAIDVGPGVTIENVALADNTGRIVTFDAVVDPAAESSRRDLVVNGGTLLDIPKAVWVAEPFEAAGNCPSTVAEGAVPDGTYFGSDRGLESGQIPASDCLPREVGREQVFPISLRKGQILTVTLFREDMAGVLYVADSCNDFSVDYCTGGRAPGELTVLEYPAYYAQDVLVVIDSLSETAPESDYVIDIRRTPPQPFFIRPRHVIEGQQQAPFTISSNAGSFGSSDTYDLGPDITVNRTSLFATEADLFTTVSNTPTSRSADVTVTRGGTPYTLKDLITIGEFLDTPASCTAADNADPLRPGSHAGITFGGGDGAASPVPCLSSSADGSEAIYRVEIPASQTLRARVLMPEKDAVLYVVEDCAGPVLACSDVSPTYGEESVEWTGPPYDSTVYLVVDGYGIDDTGSFEIEVEMVK